MSKHESRKISNDFLAVRLISLASWPQAAEINPRDHHGPYVVVQEGYDPEDLDSSADEFVLGRSGQWLSVGFFYQMPVAERRAEFIFGTAAEVMETLQDLPSKPAVLRPGGSPAEAPPEDELTAALEAGRASAEKPGM